MTPLPPQLIDVVHEACRRFIVGGIPGFHFLIKRVEGQDDTTHTIGRPAATSRLKSYRFVVRLRVIYALCEMGISKEHAKEVWQHRLADLNPPEYGVNHTEWYVAHYYRSTFGPK